MASPRIFALIVAAGTGSRAGGQLPKQYAAICGKPLLRYSVEAFLNHPAIAGVQVMIHPDHMHFYTQAVGLGNLSLRERSDFQVSAQQHLGNPGEGVVPQAVPLFPPIHGGEQRADSVRAGLAALAPHAPDYVLIHDAARPFLSAGMIDRIVAALTPGQGVVPALPVADTVRRFDGNAWREISRDGLLRIQTPQAFAFAALNKLYASSPGATDEAAVWLAAGNELAYVTGDEELRKVTTAEDIRWAQKKCAATRCVVGMGYDVHALMPSGDAGVIRLGGIDIAHGHKLHGHSDADVVLHAIVDALLGSIAAGDIGSFFPPTDARWKGANSAIFIEEARAQVAARGGEIQHLDVTIIGEQPKIAPHREAMREAIAALLKLPLTRVSVKATTTEKLGFTGREEGIAAQAVATVTLPMEDA